MRRFAGSCRRTTASLLAAATTLLVLAVAAPAQASDCAYADAMPGEAAPADLAQATLCLLNGERAAAGLGALTASSPLTTTAERYAEYMVSDEHFAHQDESGHNVVSRVLETDPTLADRWLVIGENLGWGTYSLATPSAMVDGWMASPSHRANILDERYDEIGIGIAEGAPVPDRTNGLTYTTVFGKVAPASPASPAKPRESGPRNSTARHTRPAACKRVKRARTRSARARAKRRCAARRTARRA